MIGLPAHAAIGGPGEWLERVHPDDIADLNAALEAHLAGSTQVFQHEHRIRHEDGTYRRFLCRGLAVQGAGRKPDRIAGSLTDTTEQAIAQERLRSVGFLDSLTGLSNRAVFVEGLGRRLDECRRRGPAATASRCSISISIGSRSSTTVSATWSATSCWSRRRAGWSRACGRATRWRGSAATSSRSS